MATWTFQSADMLKADYVACYGKLHPMFEDLAPEAQIELLKQAKEQGVVLDDRTIREFLGDLDRRLALVAKLAELAV